MAYEIIPIYLGSFEPPMHSKKPGSLGHCSTESIHQVQLNVGACPTWRIIPVSKWLITMVNKSPNWGCSPYKLPFYGL